MADIEIVPLFKQTSPTWHDFAYIRLAAQRELDLPYDAAEYHNAYTEYQELWQSYRRVASFAAYDGNKMVGFVNGELTADWMHVDALYVHPKYQGGHIGRRLLVAMENAATPFVNVVQLTSLTNAIGFYHKMGYSTPPSRYERSMEKKLTTNGRAARVVPVFHSARAMSNACRTIFADYDATNVNRAHRPMFAFFDIDDILRGFIDVDGLHVATGYAPGFVENCLAKCMEKYRAMHLARRTPERE